MIKHAFYFIRTLQILIKFVALLFIPNTLNIVDMASYGYINTLVNVFVVLYGMELWYYYNRETSKADSHSYLLNKQYSLYLFLYIIYTPFLIYMLRTFDAETIAMVVVFGVLSHWVQEIVRSLIHVGKLTESALVNVVQSLWVVIFLPGKMLSIEMFLLSMLISTFLSFILGWYFLGALSISGLFNKDIFIFNRLLKDIQYIKCYFFSSLSMRLALSIPVLFYKHINAETPLAVYSYYYALASGMEFFIYYFVQSKYISKLIHANSNNRPEFLRLKKEYFLQNSIAIVVLLSGAVGFCFYILPLLITNKDIIQYVNVSVYILVAMSIMNFSNYYAVVLYAQQCDISNLRTPPYALVLALLMAIACFYFVESLIAVGLCYILSLAVSILMIRYLYWFKYDKYEKRASIF